MVKKIKNSNFSRIIFLIIILIIFLGVTNFHSTGYLGGGAIPVSYVCGDNNADPGEDCDGTDLDGKECSDVDEVTEYRCGFMTAHNSDAIYLGWQWYIEGEKGRGGETYRIVDGSTIINTLTSTNAGCDGTWTCSDNGCIHYHISNETCKCSVDLTGGTLGCKSDCTFDTSSCTKYVCGDNSKDPGEECDGTDLNSKDCTDFEFVDGTLECLSDCSDFDTSGCHMCGNNVIDDNEICDGTDLDGKECSDFNDGEGNPFVEGTLACFPDCLEFDTSGCAGKEIEETSDCGNNIKEEGESCDGTDLDGKECSDLGFIGGTLGCKSYCTFDASECIEDVETPAEYCGNSVIDSGEDCDGSNLLGLGCNNFADTKGNPFSGGTLKCKSDCTDFDTSRCIESSVQGIEEPEVEEPVAEETPEEEEPIISPPSEEKEVPRRTKKKFPSWIIIVLILIMVFFFLIKKKKGKKAPLPDVKVSPELVKYVKKQFKAGYNSVGIKKAMIEAGYTQVDTNAAIRKAKEEMSTR